MGLPWLSLSLQRKQSPACFLLMKTSQITDQSELGEPRRLPAQPAANQDRAGCCINASVQVGSSEQGLGAMGSGQGERGWGASACPGAAVPRAGLFSEPCMPRPSQDHCVLWRRGQTPLVLRVL